MIVQEIQATQRGQVIVEIFSKKFREASAGCPYCRQVRKTQLKIVKFDVSWGSDGNFSRGWTVGAIGLPFHVVPHQDATVGLGFEFPLKFLWDSNVAFTAKGVEKTQIGVVSCYKLHW